VLLLLAKFLLPTKLRQSPQILLPHPEHGLRSLLYLPRLLDLLYQLHHATDAAATTAGKATAGATATRAATATRPGDAGAAPSPLTASLGLC
jgi:hypothetical protein